MARLPRGLSGRAVARILERVGFVFERQKGSHMRYFGSGRHVTVPDHKTLDLGTLRAILRQAGLTVDQFVKLL